MATADYPAVRARRRRRPGWLAHQLRILRVIATVEFKLKYADSVLGYAWSLAKPLAYFGVIYLVFGHFIKIAAAVDNFALHLFLGLVLYTFFTDAVGLMLPSIATRGSILRRMAFEPLVIPISVSVTAAITLLVNLAAVAVFVGGSRVVPELDWVLVLPLLAELYLFVLGIGLIVTTLFIRFHDVAQLWELTAQLMIFASPVMYPISIFPGWAQKIVFLNPFVQVMQDMRALILGQTGTAATAYGTSFGRLLPIGVTFLVLLGGLALFRRDAPYFAERV
jgi:ABC-2 type transport system permease protein